MYRNRSAELPLYRLPTIYILSTVFLYVCILFSFFFFFDFVLHSKLICVMMCGRSCHTRGSMLLPPFSKFTVPYSFHLKNLNTQIDWAIRSFVYEHWANSFERALFSSVRVFVVQFQYIPKATFVRCLFELIPSKLPLSKHNWWNFLFSVIVWPLAILFFLYHSVVQTSCLPS